MSDVDEQLQVLKHGVADISPADEFERRVRAVAAGERPPLRVKFGIDPTSTDLHLGHSVVLRKLAEFQRFGHTAVLIIGGFTAQVGDPSGKSATRPRLTPQQVTANAQTYLDQVRLILRDDPLEITDNRDWLAGLTLADVLGLTSQMTVARMLERSDFADRYGSQTPIAISEFLYPLLQGQDSVAVRADVELGGTDQTFNLMAGRGLQTAAGQKPQCVLTMPLIEGLDGAAKMSKSLGNAIGVTDDPADMYGKAMRLRDELIVKYLQLTTDVPRGDVADIAARLADDTLHPRDAKRRLARELVTLYHSDEAAHRAQERFDVQFRDRGVPDDIPTVTLDDARWFLPSLLQAADLVSSGSEARRMVDQGAVRLDGAVLADATAEYDVADLDGRALQVGKRRFVRLKARNDAEPDGSGDPTTHPDG
ncbi:tyrosine--tRNA ligase [soil metagenome]